MKMRYGTEETSRMLASFMYKLPSGRHWMMMMIHLPPVCYMSHYLHLLLFLRLQNAVANNPHLWVLLALFLRFESKLLEGEMLRVVLMHYFVGFRILVDDLERGVTLRKFKRLLVIQTQPSVVVSYPVRKFAAIVVIVHWKWGILLFWK